MSDTVAENVGTDQPLPEHNTVEIQFDLLCDWGDKPPVYRIYVDDDLLTERSYIWRNDQNCVRENVIVSLYPGDHRVNIVNVYPELGRFWAENITINGVSVPDLEFVVA